jgi:cholest-4-en-3-one 26-monooxygenase
VSTTAPTSSAPTTIGSGDIDIYSNDIYVEGVPHDLLARLRHDAPIYLHQQVEADQPASFWVLTRHSDVVRTSRVFETYSSGRAGCLLVDNREDLQLARMIIDLDPPEHTRLRTLVARAFTPRAVKSLDGHYREVTAKLIDDVLARREVDFVTDVAAELPLIAIAELMGVPVADRHNLFEWSNAMIGANDAEYQQGMAPEVAMAELYTYAQTLAAQRRLDPRDDIITTLLTAEDGDALTDHEFDLFILLLSVAGNETTRNAISHGINAFIEHPDQWARLRADPSLLDTAVEEILRWGTPVMQFRRTATVDIVVHDEQIKEGDAVVMSYSSANRDESVFEDPYTFDIGRSPNPHVAFGGGGPHFCLGAQLARLEMRILFEEMLRRVDKIELTGEVSRLRSNFINGIKHLPVKLTAG